jgi:hypothetical protein
MLPFAQRINSRATKATTPPFGGFHIWYNFFFNKIWYEFYNWIPVGATTRSRYRLYWKTAHLLGHTRACPVC